MRLRMKNPALVVPGAVEALQNLGRVAIEHGGVPMTTVGLIQLRVSMINGWVHAGFVGKLRDTRERLHAVAAWRDAPFYTDAERAALALTDAVTRLAGRDDPVPDDVWEEATRHYDERTLAGLIVCIANMNMWNRLTVTTRQPAGEYVTVDTVQSRDGTTITYEKRGTGPALVMVDGANCYRAFGPALGLAPHLAQDLTVYIYDRRGRGDSGDTGPYSTDREIEDLQAVINAAGGENVGIYGMSSGAVLALEAAAKGVTGIGRLALWEPPLERSDEAAEIRPKLDELIADGRNGEAVDLFQATIGVPEETRTNLRDSMFWPAMSAVAHTVVYDLAITGSATARRYTSVTNPSLVIDTNTNERLHADALAVLDALPNATHRTVPAVGVGRPLTAHLLSTLAEYFAA